MSSAEYEPARFPWWAKVYKCINAIGKESNSASAKHEILAMILRYAVILAKFSNDVPLLFAHRESMQLFNLFYVRLNNELVYYVLIGELLLGKK